jgi:peptidoglycan/LPS O-acetylase OafA/YrhL
MRNANSALNVMRALAATVVCLGHVRGYLLVPREDAPSSIVTTISYALTSMGHGAVMIFFVLSGFFVGGSVLRSRAGGRFIWPTYLIARGVRLWVVLLPALVLTLLLDRIGTALYPASKGYGPGSDAVTRGGPPEFFGNAFFLQSWLVEPYGSNGALWSLAFEWAYYLLFPLLLVLFARRTAVVTRLLVGCLVAVVATLGGPSALVLFSAWILGAAAAWQQERLARLITGLPPVTLVTSRLVAVALTIGAMALDKAQGGSPDRVTTGTLLCGLCATALVALFITDAEPRSRPAKFALMFTSTRLAESSYSLYAYHLPVLLMIATALTPSGDPRRFEPDAFGWGLVALVTLALIAGGWIFAQASEVHYPSVRARVEGLILRKGART